MKKLLAIAALLIGLSACHKPENALEKYDRTTLLTNLADSVIAPSYTQFANGSLQLSQAANTFVVSPDAGNLNALRTAWSQTVAIWQACEMYNLEFASANSLAAQIASWPVDTNVIENEITGSATLDEAYVQTTGTTRKGLSAVEYLIYGAGNDQAVLDSFTTSTNAPRRKQYLAALCAHIKTQGNLAANDWNNGTSHNHFIAQTQLDISGSMNVLVNCLIEHIEAVRKNKISKPLGIDNAGVADGNLTENHRAPLSLESIKANIAAWKVLFNGASGKGFDDYLLAVNAKHDTEDLSVTINNQLDLCLAKANAITVPLHLAVTQQPANVQALYLELKKLTVLTKVEMASSLGVIITFSDNDGD